MNRDALIGMAIVVARALDIPMETIAAAARLWLP